MLYKGKEVFTRDTFDYDSARPGDYVSQEVVDNAMDCLPPVRVSSACSQMGEPWSHRRDPLTGRWRATYATFRRMTEGPEGVWEYCGHCFAGDTVELGQDLTYDVGEAV